MIYDEKPYDDPEERFVDEASVGIFEDYDGPDNPVVQPLDSELPAKDLTPYTIGHSLSPNT